MSYISDFKSNDFDLFQTSTDLGANVSLTGSRWRDNKGREFVIVQNGGTALEAGKLVSSVAPVANFTGLVVTAYTSGQNAEPGSAPFNPPASTGPVNATVTVTLAGTAALANEYAGGFLQVKTGTGIGQNLEILSHPAQTSTTGSLVITLADTPAVALDTTSTVDLLHNPYGSPFGTNASTNGVVVTPTSFTGTVVGLCHYAIPATTTTGNYQLGYGTVQGITGTPSYGYVLARGQGTGISQTTVAIGAAVSPSTTTAGEFMATALSGSALTTAVVGYAVQAGVGGDGQAVYMQL